MNIHITRADHDACRMLAGRALHPGYTGGEFFDENIIECQPAVLRVFLDETIRCFILNACDGAGTEDIVAAEKLFGIFVRDALIVSRGEIKVDIRYLSPSNPRKTANGMSCPFFERSLPHFGHFLSGRSKPPPTEPSSKKWVQWHFGQSSAAGEDSPL